MYYVVTGAAGFIGSNIVKALNERGITNIIAVDNLTKADKFKNLIAANGTIDSVDDWGKKRLAYPINDETEGVYTVISFTSEPDFPAELDRVFKITEGVLRSMTLAVEE